VGITLSKYGNQDIRAVYFLFVGGLHMQDSALDNPLETQRGLGIDIVLTRNDRGMFSNETRYIVPERIDIRATGEQYLRRRGIIQESEQEVLNRDEFMPFLPRLNEG
jgi:hypothetical protein